MVIGIVGTFGAGKGVVVEYLKAHGFVSYSSSGMLGELVEKEGNPRIREHLAQMATRLQEEYPGGVVEKNYKEKYLVEKPEHAIFEAIHRQTEADFVKSIGGKILAVDAPIEVRYERIHARQEGEKDNVSFEQFQHDAQVEEEGGGDASRDNNIRAVINTAEYVIQNKSTLEELHQQIEEVLHQIKNGNNQ